MDLELENKSFFIAGSSRGIGLAIAEAFLQEGASVLITARSAENLREVDENLAARFGSKQVRSFYGDLTQPETIAAAIDYHMQGYGHLDGVIANLGGSEAAVSGWDVTSENWDEVLKLNLTSSMLLASAAIPVLTTPGATITFVSSIAGTEAVGAPLAYAAAKAALNSGMKSLCRLVGPQGIRVNAVVPGNIYFKGGVWERRASAFPDAVDKLIKNEVPLQRFGRPEEIANAVTFLASARAGFITGAALAIDGGQTRTV